MYLPLHTKLMIGGGLALVAGIGVHAWRAWAPDGAPRPDASIGNALLGIGAVTALAGVALLGWNWKRDLAVQSVWDARVGATTVRDVADDVYRFRIEGDMLLSSRAIVPDSPAASLAWKSDYRNEIERTLRGAIGTLDAQSAQVQLKTITFTGSDDAFRAANVVRAAQAGTVSRADLPDIAMHLRRAAHDLRNTGAYYEAGHIVIGPQASTVVLADAVRMPLALDASTLHRLRLNTGVLLAHELRHAVTPSPFVERLAWLEEGGVDLFAHAVGRQTASATGLGTISGKASPSVGYPQYRAVVDRLLQLSGFETASPVGLAHAERFFQTHELPDLAQQLSRRIVEHHALAEPSLGTVHTAIMGLEGSLRRIDRLAELVARLALRATPGQ